MIRIECGICMGTDMDAAVLALSLPLPLTLGCACGCAPRCMLHVHVGGADDVPLMAIPRQIKRKCDVDGNKYKVNRFVSAKVQSCVVPATLLHKYLERTKEKRIGWEGVRNGATNNRKVGTFRMVIDTGNMWNRKSIGAAQ